MVMRIRWQKQGGHVHCRVFTAPTVVHTFAKVGELVFDEKEWPMAHEMLVSIAMVIPEEAT